jgi:hypothetical protein
VRADIGFEPAPSVAHEVIADVGGAIRGGVRSRLAGALDRANGDGHLRFAGRSGELFDGLPLKIARHEVHRAVDAGRIPLKDLVHETDALEVPAPVERRAQPQARHGVRHRHL